jgi:hypothetical protein
MGWSCSSFKVPAKFVLKVAVILFGGNRYVAEGYMVLKANGPAEAIEISQYHGLNRFIGNQRSIGCCVADWR